MYNKENLHDKIKAIGGKLSEDGTRLNKEIVLAGLQAFKHLNKITSK